MLKSDYIKYQAVVSSFLCDEGINALSCKSCDDASETENEFICECCTRRQFSLEHQVSAWCESMKEVVWYTVCHDCLYYVAHGTLDDQTMLDMVDDTNPRAKELWRTILNNEKYTAYADTILFTCDDDNDEPLDNHFGIHKFADVTCQLMIEDCDSFIEKAGESIYDREVEAMQDFWLTRNGHGAGFWDGDWPENGDELDDIASSYPSIDAYVGDDSLIYLS